MTIRVWSVALDWLTDLRNWGWWGEEWIGKAAKDTLEKLKKFTMGCIDDFIM